MELNLSNHSNVREASASYNNQKVPSSPKSSAKRTRILKACDICRSRKLKCDGNTPCKRCAKTGLTCEYTRTDKRKKPTSPSPPPFNIAPAHTSVVAPAITNPSPTIHKHSSNKEKIGVGCGTADTATTSSLSLDARMSKLEHLMTMLVNKISHSPTFANDGHILNDIHRDSPSSVSSGDFHSPLSQNHHVGKPATPLSSATATNTPNGTFQSVASSDILEISNATSTNTKQNGPLPKYCGSQSSLSVLSAKGLIWLARRARDPSMLHQFQKIYQLSSQTYFTHIKKWVEPITREQIVALPPREEASALIDLVFCEFSEQVFAHDSAEMQSMLGQYYDNGPDSLSNSELLSLNSYMGVGSLFMIDNGKSDDVQKYSALQEAHFLNSIFYYHRLTILNEGLKTVQAMLSLILYCEFATTPHNNYMIISTAVRYAQELGLHREESFYGLSPNEVIKRRKLWFHVYLFDRDFCLKSGKPPIIHDSDVSCKDFDILSHNDLTMPGFEFLNNRDIDITTPDKLSKLPPNIGPYIHSIIKHEVFRSYCLFTKFTSVTYTELFSANALNGCTIDDIIKKINKLNSLYDTVSVQLPFSLRPGAKNINWHLFDEGLQQDVRVMHLHCFLHRMNITRMAFRRSWLDDDGDVKPQDYRKASPVQKKMMDECLGSARGMLKIFTSMSSDRKSCFNHLSFLFFSAFFTMLTGCLEYPDTGLLKSDILLMKSAVETYFDKLSIRSASFKDMEIFKAIAYFLRFFVRVAIDIHNSEQPDKIDRGPLDAELKHFEGLVASQQPNNAAKPPGMAHYNPCSMQETPNIIHYDPVRNTNRVSPSRNSPLSSQALPSNMPNILPHQNTFTMPQQNMRSSRYGTSPNSSNTSQFVNSPSIFDDLQFLNDFQNNFNAGSLNQLDSNNNNVLHQIFSIPNVYLNFDDINGATFGGASVGQNWA